MEVTLQVSVTPTDLPQARHSLAHQLGHWEDAVEEVLLTYDLRRSSTRSYYAVEWDERRPGMDALLHELAAGGPKRRLEVVDYSAEALRRVSQRFLRGQPTPDKSARGGPFHAYFWGLLQARHDLVLHTDADMLYGGAAQPWLTEALEMLGRDEVLAVAPLSGPPTRPPAPQRAGGERISGPGRAFALDYLSTRVFLLDRRELERDGGLDIDVPLPLTKRAKSILYRHPPAAAVEMIVSATMRARKQVRIDLLGSGPGCWSLHPPYRSPGYLAVLPRIIERIERGDVPDDQRGDYDLNEGFYRWSHDPLAMRVRRLWA
jgi:hypothetical protein